MIAVDSILGLSVLAATGTEPNAFGGALVPGIHLRLSYPPEMPWPARGFRVERRTLRLNEFHQPGPWLHLTTLFPLTHRRSRSEALAEVRRRHNELYAGALSELREVDLNGLIDLLLAGPGAAGLGRLSIDRSHLLFLASLAPAVARVVGLGWIDHGVPPGAAVEFRVTGLWGTASWPIQEHFTAGPAALETALAGVRLETARGATEDSGRLALRGVGELALTARLLTETREITFAIESDSGAEWAAQALDANGREQEVAVAVTRLGVQVTSPEPMTSVALTQRTRGTTRWLVSAIRHRRDGDQIGDVAVSREAPLLTSPVTKPMVTHVQTGEESFLPLLGAKLARPLLNARLQFGPGGPPRDPHAAPLILAERGRVRRPLPFGSPHQLADPERLTGGDHGIFPAWTAIGHWRMDGSGGERPRGEVSHLDREGRGSLPAAQFAGHGSVALQVPQLRSLGQSLSISVWIRPSVSTGVTAVVSGDWQRSFWLGRLATDGRLRLWLNQQRFETKGATGVDRWSHVAMFYDGHTVRFLLDGTLDSQHGAVLGPVAVGADPATISIGATAGATPDRPSYGFHGLIAEVLLARMEMPNPTPAPASLLSDLPLNGATLDVRSRTEAELLGGAFTDGHPEAADRQVLRLDGSGGLTLRPVLTLIDDEVTIQLWVRPLAYRAATLVSLDQRDTCMLSLDDGLAVSLTHLDRRHTSHRYLAANRWTHVVVCVARTGDGGQVRIYLDGQLDFATDTPVAPMKLDEDAPVSLGKGSAGHFTGDVANLRIWRTAPSRVRPVLATRSSVLAAYALDDDLIDSITGLPAVPVGDVDLGTEHPFRPGGHAAHLHGGFIEASAPSAFAHLGEELTVAAWVRPDRRQGASTLVGHDFQRSFWLGVAGSGKLRCWLNGRSFESRSTVAVGTWSRVAIVYDGAEVRLYVQGIEPDAVHPAVLGAVHRAPDAALILGAETGSTLDRPRYLFQGSLADVVVLSRAVAPPALEAVLAAAATSPTSLTDHVPEPGSVLHRVWGLDLFGRISASVDAGPTVLRDTTSPPAPPPPKARILHPAGSVRAASGNEESLRIETDIALPVPSADVAAVLARLPHHDLVVTRGRREERFEVIQVAPREAGLELEVTAPVLPRLVPEPGDAVSVDLDCLLEVESTWTGPHRVLAPDAVSHRCHLEVGDARRPVGVVLAIRADNDLLSVRTDADHPRPAELVAGSATVAGHSYLVESAHPAAGGLDLGLRYRARPVVGPVAGDALSLHPADLREPTTSDEWTGEQQNLVLGDALPTEVPLTDPVACASPTDREAAALTGAGLDPRGTLLIDTPPGLSATAAALVGYAVGGHRRGWTQLVEVARLDDGRRWVGRDPDTERSRVAGPLQLVSARVVPGAVLRETVALKPSFGSVPTLPVRLAVTALDAAGNQSALSPLTQVVVVDRRRPPPPPRPRVMVDAADAFGTSMAELSWADAAEPGTRFDVLRTLDETVRAVDLRHRRARTGPYERERAREPADVFADDADFGDWLAARFPEHGATGAAAMYTDHDSQAEVLWVAWADRFYPSLDDAELQAVAGYLGNESAFTLVTSRPLVESRYADPVPGAGGNRLLYRLVTRTVAHHPSLRPGPVSAPARSAWPRPPRPPSITAVEPGDRSVTVRWALNPEADVDHYLVHRAASMEELVDLRRFETTVPHGLVHRIADPRLRVRSHTVRLPGVVADGAVPAVLSLWRVDELGAADADPIAHPPRAQNLLTPGSTVDVDGEDLVVHGLRRVADDTRVVAALRDPAGGIGLVRAAAPPLELVDVGLPGLTDVGYRVVAVSRAGQRSEGSKPVAARPLEIAPPPAPEASATRFPTSAGATVDTVTLTVGAEAGLDVMVQSTRAGQVAWRTNVGWRPAEEVETWSEQLPQHTFVKYRVWSRTRHQLVCAVPEPVTVEPLPPQVSP